MSVLVWVSPGADFESRFQVEIVHLGGDPRKLRLKVWKQDREGKEATARCAVEQVTCEGTRALSWWGHSGRQSRGPKERGGWECVTGASLLANREGCFQGHEPWALPPLVPCAHSAGSQRPSVWECMLRNCSRPRMASAVRVELQISSSPEKLAGSTWAK